MRRQVNVSRSVMQSLAACLEQLCRAVDAQQALLFNPMGQQLLSHGEAEGLDLDLMVPLIANGIVAIQEASSLIDGEEGFTLYYHAGSSFDFYGASIHPDLMILLKVYRQQGQTRIGTVWYYLQQAIKSMRTVFQESLPDAPIQVNDLEPEKRLEPVPPSPVPSRTEANHQRTGEDSDQPACLGDEPGTRPSQLLSYSEAETQGLIRSKR